MLKINGFLRFGFVMRSVAFVLLAGIKCGFANIVGI